MLRTTLDAVTRERDDALREVANAGERAQGFEVRMAELREAKEALGQQFGEVGAKLLEAAQRQFLERADERFKQSEEKSGLELKALLNPVSERLQRYEEGVAKIEGGRRHLIWIWTHRLVDWLRLKLWSWVG